VIKNVIYHFPSEQSATLAEVGGKGLSLLKGSTDGLPVPPGFILSVSFFASWITSLKQTTSWQHFLKADEKTLHKACNALKIETLEFPFTKEQETTLHDSLKDFPDNSLFAVRSSSPEEDLEGTSFAGGYETVLGVNRKTLYQAIKKAFVSCLDYRIVVYKKQNGFAITDPKIAVIIQEQIASEVSGVGFSLNPVTNNYDEAVFNANFGLGETIVSGAVTPDTFIVDKIAMRSVSKTLGAKETSLWLTDIGGTKEKRAENHDQFTLDESQLLSLTELIKKVEDLYNKPIDIEWAFEEGKLYLLQARPITSFVPLPPEMMTKPDEKKKLYLDISITVQGLYKPVSPMGTSIIKEFLKRGTMAAFSRDLTADVAYSPVKITSGRMYMNVSNVLALAGRKKLGTFLTNMDSLASKTILALPDDAYVSENKEVKRLPLLLARKMPTFLTRVLNTRLRPAQVNEKLQQALQQFEKEVKELEKEHLPLGVFRDKLLALAIDRVFKNILPVLISTRVAVNEMQKIAGDDPKGEPSQLEFALPHNITTEMGLALFDVAKLLPENLTTEKLQTMLEKKQLSQEFFTAWDAFLTKYGHRGPVELDIASPRYRDDTKLLLDLLLSMRNAKTGENPQETFEKNKLKRQETYETLYKQIRSKNYLRAQQFRLLYRCVEALAGYRETPKFYLIMIIDLIRQRILKLAKQLHREGRLDSEEQVFDLTFDELEQGMRDTTLNLKELAAKNRIFIDKLAKVPQLPTIIDSRGLILRPPGPPIQKNSVSGMPVSAGIIKGKIKVLHSPDEKPLHKGEILVARATDPGWTPLFVNAGAVILEVGGLLQHGALVAREYGLPCVAGIQNATNLWKDGTMVEVDGSAGTVKTI
jgi:phosphohistidine swiveling domain-containing protein